ncbi:endo-1,4-beta-xylanase [Glycomyces sp. NPDC048151]|uniref:endo-1,4-beta-xylanase n=1 Tax=Glycomyces sp. NPDC048151 TaxID=3364002 RepID=UPI00371E010F
MEHHPPSRRKRLRAIAAGTGALVLPAALAFGGPAVAQEPAVVYAADFADGTVGDWAPRGPVTLSVADGALLTTGRTADWNGPSLDLTGLIVPGGVYEISLDVRFDAASAGEVVSTTVQREAAGTTSYDSVVYQAAVGTEWTELTGEYSIGSAADALTLYVESPTPDASYSIDNVAITEVTPPGVDPSIPSLKDVLAADFRFGAAVDPRDLAAPTGDLLNKHFNQITAENHMKPDAIQPVEGQFNFTAADQLVEHAEANGQEIYGHTFLWHSQVPDWWFTYPAGHANAGQPLGSSAEDQQIMLDRLEAHIGAIAAHYGDRIQAWDVVNEVISDNAAEVYRNSRWFQIFEGPEYISHAFRIAREQLDAVGATEVKLFINDYGTDNPAKRDNLYNLVSAMLADGVPVDGVGHQTHISLNTSLSNIEASIDKFAGLGVLQAVTELDIAIGAPAAGVEFPELEARLIQQGHFFRDLFAMLRTKDLESVTVWGLHDGRSWIRTEERPLEAPLVFTDQLQAKWAYWGIADPAKLPEIPEEPDPEYARVQVPLAKDAPVIDGRKDKAWKKASTVATEVRVEGSAEGAKADVSLMWDDAAIYALFEVTDAQLDATSANAWEQDSVEVFLNPGNTKSGGYGDADGQYRVNFANVVSLGGNGPESGAITSAVKVTSTGYTVEIAIALGEGDGVVGAEHGLELQVNDAAEGARTAVHTWYDPTGQSWSTNKYWGIAELVRKVRHCDANLPQPV